MSVTVLFCILKYQVSFNPPRWHSVCDMNGRDSSVWGRTKIFRHQSHIRGAGEAQTEGTGSRGLISEHIWDGIWVNASWGGRGRKSSDEYSQSVIYVLDVKPVCEALGLQGMGSWNRSLERAFKFLKPSHLVNEFSQFFELWLIFKKRLSVTAGSLIPWNCFFKGE